MCEAGEPARWMGVMDLGLDPDMLEGLSLVLERLVVFVRVGADSMLSIGIRGGVDLYKRIASL